MARRPFLIEGMLLLATLAWGLSFIWVKQITQSGMGTDLFIALRFGAAALIMTPFCIKALKRATRADFIYGGLIGVLMYLAMAFQTYGLMYTTPANSGFITAAYVAFVPFTAWLVLKKKPTLRVYFTAGLCVVGLYILTVGGTGIDASVGNLLTLVCALAWSFQVTLVTKAARKGSMLLLTWLPLVVMFALSLILGTIMGSLSFEGVDIKAAMLPIGLCVLFPTLLAGLAQTYAQRYIEPNKAAVIYTLESVFACAISALLGMERMTPALFMGGGLVVAAVLLGEIKPKKDSQKEETP